MELPKKREVHSKFISFEYITIFFNNQALDRFLEITQKYGSAFIINNNISH